jgi:hypothetical protein
MENESNYFDDGTPINPNLFPKPQLCLSCNKNEDKSGKITCNLTRLDRTDKEIDQMGYELYVLAERRLGLWRNHRMSPSFVLPSADGEE